MATPTAFATEASHSVVNNSITNISLTSSPSVDNATELVTSTLQLLSTSTSEGEDVFPHSSLKDETTFVALIVMGIIVPAIFITVFVLIFRQRRKVVLARRTQMLLQNTQDFALEDYTTMEKATSPPPKL